MDMQGERAVLCRPLHCAEGRGGTLVVQQGQLLQQFILKFVETSVLEFPMLVDASAV
jgi:hypothetical protein